jgi:pilus assembly protein Flp/PilA
MQAAYRWLSARFASERGVTAVEYGIMVALIAVVVMVGAAVLGTNVNQTFQDVADAMP